MTVWLFLLRRQSLVSEEDDDEDEEEGKAALQPDDKFKINKTGIHGGQLAHMECYSPRKRVRATRKEKN